MKGVAMRVFRGFVSPPTPLATKVDAFSAFNARFAGVFRAFHRLSGGLSWYPYVNLEVRPRTARHALLAADWTVGVSLASRDFSQAIEPRGLSGK
jgi:hypothetical protein